MQRHTAGRIRCVVNELAIRGPQREELASCRFGEAGFGAAIGGQDEQGTIRAAILGESIVDDELSIRRDIHLLGINPIERFQNSRRTTGNGH